MPQASPLDSPPTYAVWSDVRIRAATVKAPAIVACNGPTPSETRRCCGVVAQERNEFRVEEPVGGQFEPGVMPCGRTAPAMCAIASVQCLATNGSPPKRSRADSSPRTRNCAAKCSARRQAARESSVARGASAAPKSQYTHLMLQARVGMITSLGGPSPVRGETVLAARFCQSAATLSSGARPRLSIAC
jgi:hypothetical protein